MANGGLSETSINKGWEKRGLAILSSLFFFVNKPNKQSAELSSDRCTRNHGQDEDENEFNCCLFICCCCFSVDKWWDLAEKWINVR